MDYPTDICKPASILVVDDTPDYLDFLCNLLKDEYRVLTANQREKALQMAYSDNPPDLILLDITMPGMDGDEVCRRLKENPRTREIPVIFLTVPTGFSRTGGNGIDEDSYHFGLECDGRGGKVT